MKRFIGNEKQYLLDVLESENLKGFGDLGRMTKRLEEAFCEKYSVKHAITVTSAMCGLHCAVAASGAGPGDEVICDPVVQFGGAAVMYHNAVPVFADIDPETFNMDPKSFEKKITERTKAVIVTHLFGLPADMEEIVKIAAKHNIIVIEDNAQAINARYKDKYTGNLGDIGVFSFEQSKHITSGDGGMVTTNRDELADKIKKTKLIGWTPDTAGDLNERWKQASLGWNFRITEMQSAFLLGQFERIDSIVDRYREGPLSFIKDFGGNPVLKPQYVSKDKEHSYWVFGLTYEGESLGVSMDSFKKIMEEENVKASYGYTQRVAPALNLFMDINAYGKGCPIKCPLYKGRAEYGPGIVPEAERLLKKILLLYYKEDMKPGIGRVIERIKEVAGI